MDTRRDDDVLDALLAECLGALESGGESALEAIYRRCPDVADRLRERVRRLQQHGLLDARQPKKCIGPYRVLDVLGEGGMGVVYLAEQREPIRRRVALKVIKPGMDSRMVLARFEAERQAMALLDHPTIATIHDAGVTPEGRPYFAMELVRGEPITSYCDRHRVGTDQRLELFIRTCAGLQHAHDRGIVHRDIKPSNILVTLADGRPSPKIIDFGVAKALNQRLTERTLFTEAGQMIGTPEYMSPEQAEMTSLDVDLRTDVYSLGVVLYELLTGELPFDPRQLRQAGYREIQRCIREDEPPKPSTKVSTRSQRHKSGPPAGSVGDLVRRIRGDLDWITMCALAKDRTQRYQTVGDLAADVDRHLQHQPVRARRPSLAYGVAKFVRRHRAGLATVACAMLALVVGLLIGASPQAPQPPASVPQPEPRLEIVLADGTIVRSTTAFDSLSFRNSTGQTMRVQVRMEGDDREVLAFDLPRGEQSERRLPSWARKGRLRVETPAVRSSDVSAICEIDCFPGDTLVATPAGLRAIESLREGDVVCTSNGDRATVQLLLATQTTALAVVQTADACVRSTLGHRFRTRTRGFVAAADLLPGDEIETAASASSVLSVAIERLRVPIPTYNLVVAGDRTFLVGLRGLIAEAGVRTHGPTTSNP